jgi:NAD(P)-dependent dehydrogenase (short-subunit alcohol dehydrogenase family)
VEVRVELFNLKGRVAFVTGSTKGIGHAIARRMAEAGASVAISSRSADDCLRVSQEIVASGGRAMGASCHVERLDQHPEVLSKVRATFGEIDIFVGNASTNPHYGPVTDIGEPAFDRIFHTNVKANLWLCKALLPNMAARGQGSIILISSVSSLMGNDDIGIYAASKAAENSLVRSLAVRWGPHNIRINAIAPGLIRTDFAAALINDKAMRERVEQSTPLRRIGESDDIAGLAVMLASQAGRHITGQTITVDGGATIASPRFARA